ncbi:MAG: hypothetical protein LIO42_00070 [Oscillospiraceae bacterium]|nr:hypothetical protein [Oscillospiraceae bacterium]
MRQQLVEQILARADLAQEQVRLARSTPNPTLPFIQACVHNYVCRKFLLDPEEGKGLTMSELANLSIERALDLKLPLAKESERATTCGAAGSAAMKRALCLVAVKRAFQVDIKPRRLGYVKDTAELGELVYQAMEEEKGA